MAIKFSETELMSMSVEERLHLIADIWDSLCDRPDPIPLTGSQKSELDRRLSEYELDPHGGCEWTEVEARIRSSL